MSFAFARDVHPGCGPSCQVRTGQFLAHDPSTHEAYGRSLAAADWFEAGPRRIENGPLLIDIDECIAYLDGEPVAIRKREWDLLVFLAQRPGDVHRFSAIVLAVWGPEWVTTGGCLSPGRNALVTSINRLRQALGKHADLIENRPGIGYRLRRADVERLIGETVS